MDRRTDFSATSYSPHFVTLGFISDAHGNVEAFEQGLSVLREAGATDLYFLGDAVGYLPGTGVLKAILTHGLTAIQGNHDAMLMSDTIRKDRDHIYRHADTARELLDEERLVMAGWPIRRKLSTRAGDLLLIHGSPSDPLHGYVYPDTDLKEFGTIEARFVFMGQTHRPFIRQCGATTFVNIGSCGLPRDSGDLGSVCLFNDETGEVRIIRYNIEDATAEAMRRCGPVATEVRDLFERRSTISEHGGTNV